MGTKVKEAVIKAYTTADVEDTNYIVTLRPATGTNNINRVDVVIEQVSPAVTLTVSVNYNELLTGLGVVH